MKRTLPPILIFGLLAFLLVCLIVPAQAAEPGQDRPTAPPPPVGGETQPPGNPPPSGGDDNDKTPTRPAVYPTRTRGASPTPTVTPTITATATLTPTLTPTMTPTPILSFVDVQVYMDINRNSLFDDNEGVNGLWVTFQAGGWKTGVMTVDGAIHLVLPPDLPERTDIQMQMPYLHLSKVVRSPDLGGTSALEIRLDVPEYPVYLP